jgi:hypothetical protein
MGTVVGGSIGASNNHVNTDAPRLRPGYAERLAKGMNGRNSNETDNRCSLSSVFRTAAAGLQQRLCHKPPPTLSGYLSYPDGRWIGQPC